MSESKISEALELLRQRLPEVPDWIALVSVDGLYLAGTSTTESEERIAGYTASLEALTSKLSIFAGLGDFAFHIVAGDLGFILVILLEQDKYLLTLRFSNGTSFSALSILAKSIPSALNELANTLRENPV